ncbi:MULTISPECIES: hypothetical protein [Arthrobacter]|uniref:hypothetical protein n=1 Tax=Arthrobacter TaxID=1663 RepID=UPI000A5B94AF|nr:MULTISPECIES: hypothetical protein [Arthrobacter]
MNRILSAERRLHQTMDVLTVALFYDGAATGFDDELGMKAPRQDFPGGVLLAMVAA